jgi:hypothetical protein
MGCLILARAEAAALQRDLPTASPFHLHVEEMQNFRSGVIGSMCNQIRKYKVSLLLVTQDYSSLDEKTHAAISANVDTTICFRQSPDSAEDMARHFNREHQEFNPVALQNLNVGEAYFHGGRLLALSDGIGRRSYFVHEWHSGEMPNRRDPGALWRGHRQSSFADKIWIYWKAREAGAFQTVWGASNVRILTVTASDESIVNLSRQVARITERPLTKLFLFTTPARLFREGPLAAIWYAPQHAYDGALNRYALQALRTAMPISLLADEQLSLAA